MEIWRDRLVGHIAYENVINVFSKADLYDGEMPDAAICISAATDLNLHVPFLTLAMKLMDVDDMVIVE